MKKNILVFPCGSEVALEIHRSLKFSTHFNLIGASSVKDHGEFVYPNYVGGLPFYTDPKFISKISQVVKENDIEAIYPAMDAVAKFLKENESQIGALVIGSDIEATQIAASKIKTYELLEDVIRCPEWESSLNDVSKFPVFIKPDVGYGSRNVKLAKNLKEAQGHLGSNPNNYVFCEFLPGKEFTIDCFTNKKGELLFSAARERTRVSNGISVSTKSTLAHQDYFKTAAVKINNKLGPRGAWFFQMKENSCGKPALLEVAIRLGGSSSYFRAKGINFALLSIFDAFDYDVSILKNDYVVELDRALNNKYKLNIEYSFVYVDFDDCILLYDKLNTQLLQFIFQSINKNKKVILITRHAGNILAKLKELKIAEVFDEIIHLENNELKSSYIKADEACIFIDDSFLERSEVKSKLNIPVFSPDMVEALLD